MKVEVRRSCAQATGYRSARVKSLFNVEDGASFSHTAELPDPDQPWRIGVIVGPSGSGKTTIAAEAFGMDRFWSPQWPKDAPIIEAITPDRPFDDIPAALSAVGLGSVPPWLRPYSVLSNGERFRADMARLVLEAPDMVIVDEFTSVVDRQIAKIGAMAFAKAWRRNPAGRVVLLTPHRDVLDWLEPCWVYDTSTGRLDWGKRRRPRFDLTIYSTNWSFWPLFEPHHYLKVPPMIAATCYVGMVDDTPVAHVGFSTRPGLVEARACRLVVMPEWQGAGVGMRFLNTVCQRWKDGHNRYGIKVPTLFHTSHPGLAAALRRDQKWTQVSAVLCGGNKVRSARTILNSQFGQKTGVGSGYGGHFRAVQGFRYLGEAG